MAPRWFQDGSKMVSLIAGGVGATGPGAILGPSWISVIFFKKSCKNHWFLQHIWNWPGFSPRRERSEGPEVREGSQKRAGAHPTHPHLPGLLFFSKPPGPLNCKQCLGKHSCCVFVFLIFDIWKKRSLKIVPQTVLALKGYWRFRGGVKVMRGGPRSFLRPLTHFRALAAFSSRQKAGSLSNWLWKTNDFDNFFWKKLPQPHLALEPSWNHLGSHLGSILEPS